MAMQHALALPSFVLFIPQIREGFESLALASMGAPAGVPTPPSIVSYLHGSEGVLSSIITSLLKLLGLPPTASLAPYVILLANLITQLICVTGVNQLSSVRMPFLRILLSNILTGRTAYTTSSASPLCRLTSF